MRHCRWMQIKRCIKLNNIEKNMKHGEDGYNPAHKFDFIWGISVHNVNALTKEACLIISGNETSWVCQ